ncbi:MAG: zinc ABC transporter substrate-binding protein [Patescibacteria group bacterium]
MHTSRVIVVGVVLVGATLLAVWYGGWSSSEKPIAEEGKLSVMTSFYPLAYLAQAIGGGMVSVTNMTPPGSEPHDFEPSPRHMILMGKAKLFMYNGADFEPWVMKWRAGAFEHPERILDMAATLKGRGVSLLEKQGSVDPHVWLDPLVMIKEAEIVRDSFSLLDPAQTDYYTENAVRVIDLLTNLDRAFRAGLGVCEQNDIVVSHEAFEYLARAYGIHVTSIAGISPDEEPSPKELARIVALVRAKGVKYVFFETTASPKLSEVLAREIGGETLVLNPLESLTPHELQSGEDYVSLMMMNLNNLRKALVCQ